MRRRALGRRGDGSGRATGVVHGARRGMTSLARLVELITAGVVLVIALGILLVVLKANPANDIVSAVDDAARFLAGPFKDLFQLKNPRTEVAVNWGIAAAVYFVVGRVIARVLRRA